MRRRIQRYRFRIHNTFSRISNEIDYLKNEKKDGDKIAPFWEQFSTPGAITLKGILFILFVTVVLCALILPLLLS